MSFILDALRKSDAERQRNAAPAITDARYSPLPGRRSPWLPVLALALLANLVFFGWWLLDRDDAPAAAPPGIPPAAMSPGRTAAGPPPQPATESWSPPPAERPLPAVRPLAREADPEPAPVPEGPDAPVEAPIVAEMAERPRESPSVIAPAADAAPPAPADSAPVRPAPTADDASVRVARGLPTADELVADGRLPGPGLVLELHVYSSTPQNRFVIINSRRYNEGATLNEGPTVESITSDGVILSSRGTRFVLPRR